MSASVLGQAASLLVVWLQVLRADSLVGPHPMVALSEQSGPQGVQTHIGLQGVERASLSDCPTLSFPRPQIFLLACRLNSVLNSACQAAFAIVT